jgi:hypothetical protein
MFILTQHFIEIVTNEPRTIPLSTHKLKKLPELMTQFTTRFPIDKGCLPRRSYFRSNKDINTPRVTRLESHRDRRHPKEG